MIYVTGDTHGTIDIEKLYQFEGYMGSSINKDDYVIILGDAGILFTGSFDDERNQRMIDLYSSFPFTTLFIDGNHDNHHLLSELVTEPKFDSEVGVINDSIYHLRRGHIYTIEDMIFLTIGGGLSIDKYRRKLNIDYWEEEMPSYQELVRATENLEKVNKEVDYVLTHEPRQDVFDTYLDMDNLYDQYKNKYPDVIAFRKWLQFIDIKYKKWFSGHLHVDCEVDEKHMLVYNKIIRIEKGILS